MDGECLVTGNPEQDVSVAAVSNVIDMPSLDACNEDVTVVETEDTEVALVETVDTEAALVETSDPDVVLVETTVPDVELVETTVPDVELVETADPDVELVETAVPDVELVETTVPDVELVETAISEVSVIGNAVPEMVETTYMIETPVEAAPPMETFENASLVYANNESVSVAEVSAEEVEIIKEESTIEPVVIECPKEEEIQEYPVTVQETIAEEAETVSVIIPTQDHSDATNKNLSIEESALQETVQLIDNGDISADNLKSQLENYEVIEEPEVQQVEVNSTDVLEEVISINGDQKIEETLNIVEVPIVTYVATTGTEIITDSVIENLGEEHMIIEENVIIEEQEVESHENQLTEIQEELKTEQQDTLANIPRHVLGRNIENPLEDPVKNGRTLLKPRLGVKIPYRNLTSQIVSKQEITDEIMERSRQRQCTAEPPQGGDIFFTKKLTQRLASKLTSGEALEKSGNSSPNSSATSSSALSSGITKLDVSSRETSVKTVEASNKIANSDLIALLEGDDDIEWNLESVTPVPPKKNTIEWEREVALKQLRELPKGNSKSTKIPVKSSSHENKTEDDINNVPRFSSSSVMKTYTRKRKPSGDIQSILLSASKKINSNTTPESKSTGESKKTVVEPKKTTTEPKKPTTESKKSTSELKKATPEPKKATTELKKATSEPKKTTSELKKATSEAKKATSEPKKITSESKKPTAETKKATEVKAKIIDIKPAVSSSPSKSVTKESQKSSSSSLSKSDISIKSSNAKKAEKKEVSQEDKKEVVKKSPAVVASKKRASSTEKPEPVEQPSQQGAISPNTYISKSSRVVKRKKIWDPDEALPKAKSPPFKSSKLMDTSKTTASVNEKAVTTPKSSEPKKTKVLKPSNDKVKPVVAEKTAKEQQEKLPPKLLKEKISPVQTIKKSPVKRKSGRLSEVDRLLMDEGAVNLLYSVKNTEEVQNLINKRKKKGRFSLDKAQRELINKTNEIKNELQLNSTIDSPISLRKKEPTIKLTPLKDMTTAILQRKKSKDSVSGSVHSPPASPGFNYADQAEGSRLIRRHSSSSFSSESSDDGDSSYKPEDAPIEKKRKKLKVNHDKQAITVDKQVLNREMAKNFNKSTPEDAGYSHFKTLSVTHEKNLVQLIIAPTSSDGQSALTLEIMKELSEILGALQKDDSCRVVLVSSEGNSFCQGLDYSKLFSQEAEEKKNVAETYAKAVKDFLICLAKFPKVIVAGVHGSTLGLGVTMLPLFDMVLASDSATFSAPYARLGCPAEGGNLLTLPHIMHNSLASELFFASRKLTAAEGLRQGLVTRTLWPDKFQEEVISVLKVIAGQSLQSMLVIKAQLRSQLLMSVESALASETSLLVEHWTSDECQKNFKSYNLKLK